MAVYMLHRWWLMREGEWMSDRDLPSSDQPLCHDVCVSCTLVSCSSQLYQNSKYFHVLGTCHENENQNEHEHYERKDEFV